MADKIMQVEKKQVVIIETPFDAQSEADFMDNVELARNICKIAVFNKFNPFCGNLLYPQYLDHNIPEEFQLSAEMSLYAARMMKPRCVWVVMRDGQHRVDRQVTFNLTQHMAMGLPIRYWRTPDNGMTIREVTDLSSDIGSEINWKIAREIGG